MFPFTTNGGGIMIRNGFSTTNPRNMTLYHDDLVRSVPTQEIVLEENQPYINIECLANMTIDQLNNRCVITSKELINCSVSDGDIKIKSPWDMEINGVRYCTRSKDDCVYSKHWIFSNFERFRMMNISGSCNINGKVKIKNLSLSGASDVYLKGDSKIESCSVSGTGSLNIQTSHDCSVSLSGCGSIHIICDGELDASVSGMGDITGSARRIRKYVSGMGSINVSV